MRPSREVGFQWFGLLAPGLAVGWLAGFLSRSKWRTARRDHTEANAEARMEKANAIRVIRQYQRQARKVRAETSVYLP